MDLMGKRSQLVENMRENIIVKKGKGFWITSKLVINEKQKREVKEEKEESKSEPEKAEYVSFLCPFLCVSVFHSSSAFGDAVGRISGYKVTPVISVEASSSVGGDQCKHLPGEVWGALLSLSGSMRNLFVCFSAETTL